MMVDETMQPWSVQCLIEWLRVREKGGKSFPHSVENFINLLSHSALFKRLLDGKNAFEEPPPLSFDQPWYELIETGHGEPLEVYEGDHFERQVFQGDIMMINRYPWKIVKKIYPEDRSDSTFPDAFIITYGRGVRRFKLFQQETCRWRMELDGSLRNS